MIGGCCGKRKTVKDRTLTSEVDTSVKSALRAYRVRCNLTKVGLEMRESCDLLKHLNRKRDLTGSKERILVICSSGMNSGDGMPLRERRDSVGVR